MNVSSVEAHVPLAYEASYAATKAAITPLDAALNQELRLAGAEGIKIVTVEPWGVDTPFYEHAANYTGVDAIVRAAIHPFRGEYPVGWKAAGGLVGAQIWPEFAARVGANVIRRAQIERAPPAPPTAGALYEPVPSGTGVEGNVRARMEQEDRRAWSGHDGH